MTQNANRKWRAGRQLPRRSRRQGKLSIVTVFTLLFFTVMLLFVGNVGRTVSHKIEMQNAADSVAYSSALWEARALNAITTTNHLMGELTAITVVLDSFGGTMLGSGNQYVSDESNLLFAKLEQKKDNYCGGEPQITGPISGYVRQVDKPIVQEIVSKNLLLSDEAKHYSAAAIYDSKLSLRNWALLVLQIKLLANYGIKAGVVLQAVVLTKPISVVIDGAASLLHIAMTAELVEISKEWLIIEATETALGTVNIAGSTRDVTFDAILPTISLYADGVVGSSVVEKLGGSSTYSFKQSIQSTKDDLVTAHRLVEATLVPSIVDLKLPVIKEPAPRSDNVDQDAGSSSRFSMPPSEWRGNFTANGMLNEIRRVFEPLSRAANRIRDFFRPFEIAADAYKRAKGLAFGAIKLPKEIQDAIDLYTNPNIVGPLAEIASFKFRSISDAGYDSNPSLQLEDYKLPEFDWQAERRSQWVRATYPYVDEYRAPVIAFFKENCPRSNFATYYSHWSNRYTLANSYLARREKEPEVDREKNRERGYLDQLRQMVADLRAKFDDATDDTDEENAGIVDAGKFKAISKLLASPDGVLRFRGFVKGLDEWFTRIASHQDEITQLGQSVSAPPNSSIPDATVKGLAEEMARINVIDELLNLLEELVDAFSLLELKEPHMYVLQGMTPESKGLTEPWINDTELAARLFCVTAEIKKQPPRLLGEVLFKPNNAEPRRAFATAMVYNANGRDITPAPTAAQPNTGWDTLNWAPPVRAPEWGDHKPSQRSDLEPWQLVKSRQLQDHNRVRINWQVKLVPIRSTDIGIENAKDLLHH